MNKHLAIVCALPTALFILGGFLLFLDSKWPIPDDTAIRDVGGMFMLGAIVIILQSLYSLYLG